VRSENNYFSQEVLLQNQIEQQPISLPLVYKMRAKIAIAEIPLYRVNGGKNFVLNIVRYFLVKR